MRWRTRASWLVALGLLATSAPAASDPPAASDEPKGSSRLEWALGATLTGTHVRLMAKPRLSWSGDHATRLRIDPVGRHLTFERLDHASGKRVRLVVEGSEVALAVYAEIDSLFTVTRHRVLLHPSARAAAVDPDRDAVGVHLPIGAPVIPVGKRGNKTSRARIVDNELEATGHVPSLALSIDFVPTEPRADPLTLRHRQLAAKVPLRVSPNGGVLARVRSGEPTTVTVRREQGKHTLVELDGEFGRAVGWVPTAKLSGGGGLLGGLIGSGGGSGGRFARLAAGTPLRHAPKGDVIGVIKRESRLLVHESDDGWLALEPRTPLGRIRVWVDSQADQGR